MFLQLGEQRALIPAAGFADHLHASFYLGEPLDELGLPGRFVAALPPLAPQATSSRPLATSIPT